MTFFRGDMFYVKNENSYALYTGILVKRSVPTLMDFVTLRPGQSIEASLDLLKGYWFPTKGEYHVSLSAGIWVHEGPISLDNVSLADFEFVSLASDPIFVLLTDVVPAPSWTIPATSNSGHLGAITAFTSCSDSQVSQANTADNNANTLIRQVNTHLSKACSNPSNYVTWMGACDATRYSQVTKNFQNIGNRRTSGYRANCTPPNCGGSGTYAYVYPSDTTYTVYLCGAFWSASVNTCVYDSKPGTLIHELSHFTSVAATSDVTYGTTSCKNLAISNPSQAIKNADNHEYLAESCPTSQ